jgi:O-antigen ligase
MFRKISDFFWVAYFPLVSIKWGITGYLGQLIGQLALLIPMLIYIFCFCIHNIRDRRINNQNSGFFTQNTTNKYFVRRNKAHISLVIVYSAFICINLFRSINSNLQLNFINVLGRVITLICVVLVVLISCSVYRSLSDINKHWNLITVGLGIYILINIIGWLLGVKNSYTENLQLINTGSLLKFLGTRVIFPFSANFQIFSIEAGLTFLLILVKGHRRNIRLNIFDYLLLISCLFVLLVVNSRNAFLAVAVSLFFLIVGSKVKQKLLFPFFLIVLFIPIIFTLSSFSNLVKNIPINLTFLTRSNNISELFTLNSRTYIWQALISKYMHFEPIQLIGYGSFGQIRSGLSMINSGYWQNPELISLHNIFLQNLVDGGYIQLILLLLLLITTFKNILVGILKNQPEKLFSFIALIYLTMCSMMDITINFNQNITFLLFLLACTQAATYYEGKNYQPNNHVINLKPISATQN